MKYTNLPSVILNIFEHKTFLLFVTKVSRFVGIESVVLLKIERITKELEIDIKKSNYLYFRFIGIFNGLIWQQH